MPPKAKKPATPGKKEEKGEAKKPLQEKKPENAPAKAKKEGAAKPAPKKKDPAPKPAAGADAAKGKDKSKKRKLNETSKPKAASTDAKKKKVEKKVQGKASTTAPKAKKPVKKQMSSKVKSKVQKRRPKRRRPAIKGKSEIIVYEGRRYFLLPSGKIKAMLDIKLEENDKVSKVDGTFIKKADVKSFEEFKESNKSLPATTLKRKLKLKLQILKRNMMKDLLKEAKVSNKPMLATPKDAGRETQVMTLFRDTWVRKKAVPRLVLFVRNKTIKIKAARKEKGPKELTEAEQKTLQRYTKKILQQENIKLRQALLCKRPSVAAKQKAAKPAKKPAKKPAPSKAAASKKGGDKKQKRPAKKAAN